MRIDRGFQSHRGPDGQLLCPAEAHHVGDSRAEGPDGQRACAFGPFVVDRLKRRLWRDERLVSITSKTFDVLVVLLQQRDHIVSKDELLSRVWPDTAVTDNSLSQCLFEIRRALDDDSQTVIRTVARRGYVFDAAVSMVFGSRRSASGR